jgi:hypothetical protein
MTFYSILYAILFLGSWREMIRALGEGNWDNFWLAATLTMFIFNDVLYTSHFIEKEPGSYSIFMKISDVVSFLFLAIAILALNPIKTNIFEASPGKWFEDYPRVSVFWGVLSVYWINLILWNLFGAYFSGAHVNLWMYLVWLVLLLGMFVLSFLGSSDLQRIAAAAVFGISVVFFLIVKPYIFYERKSTAPASST